MGILVKKSGGHTMSNIFNLLDKRSSRYGIEKSTTVTEEQVVTLVENAIQKTPSSFNAQTQRAVVLFGEKSDKFWDITLEELRKVAPAEGFENTVAKINSFKAGNGTILYYFDKNVVTGLQEQFALYADNFPIWAQQENGMFQLVTWTALESLGLGGSLQHYNPLVDAPTAAEFDVPSNWQLVAQMPFGNPIDQHSLKDKMDVNEKVLIVK